MHMQYLIVFYMNVFRVIECFTWYDISSFSVIWRQAREEAKQIKATSIIIIIIESHSLSTHRDNFAGITVVHLTHLLRLAGPQTSAHSPPSYLFRNETMASRAPGGRPSARFAQFKLVLLGMPSLPEYRIRSLDAGCWMLTSVFFYIGESAVGKVNLLSLD